MTGPGQYEARIVADSINQGVRLTSMLVTFPRCVLAEFNTHRAFSRNSASSRAIPIEKQVAAVMDTPFIPLEWTMKQKGMQGHRLLMDDDRHIAERLWLKARDAAVESVLELDSYLEIHKQDANRLLEPWMYHTVLVTSTEWDNFFALRCPDPDNVTYVPRSMLDPYFPADPKIQPAALLMKQVLEQSTPETISEFDWHLPFWNAFHIDRDLIKSGWGETGYHHLGTGVYLTQKVLVSAGRCARLSTMSHEGNYDVSADVKLALSLLDNGHWSPWEHPAYVLGNSSPLHKSNLAYPWVQARKLFPQEAVFQR